jgi:isopenicillin-N epimerase
VRTRFLLDPEVTFLNHGSFGACPREVIAAQREFQDRLEREPVRFFVREAPALLAAAREALGTVLGADPDDLAFVSNATSGVNTVLRSLTFAPGDELLRTDHGYNACNNVLAWVAERTGAREVVARLPFPVPSEEAVVEAVLACVTPRTRLALLDVVTSPTGLVLPFERLTAALEDRGITVLLDAAHAPGMVELDLGNSRASYVTGNCHKWLCAPKGAAFLWVRRELQERVRPLTISHGANAGHTGNARFRAEFDWTGTQDLSPVLAIPAALRFLEGALPGGLPAVMIRNRALAEEARGILCDALDVPPPSPLSMIGSLAAVPLPGEHPPLAQGSIDPLQERLFQEHRIEVPIVPFPAGRRLVRISAQLYNERADYLKLAGALRAARG